MTRINTRRPSTLPITLAMGLALAPLLASGPAWAQPSANPANPAGTGMIRTPDRPAGTTSAPDGSPGNPAGTAVGRALDRATGTPTAPDGTPGNPSGTALGRAVSPGVPSVMAPSAVSPSAISPPGNMTPGAATLARPRLSQIIGAAVYNERNERVGEVDDILLSPPGTAAPATAGGPTAIIQVGGFLGMGGRLVTLPLGDLRWNTEREHIVMPGATKDSLGTRPAFDYGTLRGR